MGVGTVQLTADLASFISSNSVRNKNMTTYALISYTNAVSNTIEWDGITQWMPDSGITAIPSNAPIGSIWNGIEIDPEP